MAESKSTLRRKIIALRNNLEDAEAEKKAEIITNKLMQMDIFKDSRTVLAYMSIRKEVGTKKIINNCLNNGKFVYLPVVIKGNRNLEFYRVLDINKELRLGTYGIYEPEICENKKLQKDEIDLIIIPGVAFDLSKNRLGYGAGYYDSFLKQTASNAVKIGLAYDFQILDLIPAEEFDIKMDMIITEKRIIV